MKNIVILPVLVLSLMGYGLKHSHGSPANSITTPVKLLQTDTAGKLSGQWFLLAVLPSDTATGKIATISFDVTKNVFTGNTGCNTMRGVFRLSGKSLLFNANIITTQKACEGYNEAAFLKSLLRTDSYKFDNGMLILLFGTTELSRWTRQPVHASKVNRA